MCIRDSSSTGGIYEINLKVDSLEFRDTKYGFSYKGHLRDKKYNSLNLDRDVQFNKKWDIGATWVYGTGNAMTFPQAVYLGMLDTSPFGDQLSVGSVESYGERNSTRLPAYHRFDFGINKNSYKKKWESTWSLGVYNLYNRKNPWFAYLSYEANERVANQVSLFPIIPSISYRIKF